MRQKKSLRGGGLRRIHLVQYPLNMSIAGLAEGDEEYPGMYLPLNNDDDNNNSIPDYQENYVAGEDDLVAVTIDAAAFLPGDTTLYLKETGATGKLKIWTEATKGLGSEVDISGDGYAILNSNLPITFYAEGYDIATIPTPSGLKLLICGIENTSNITDILKIFVGCGCDVDLDVDSDNNNCIFPYGPDHSLQEDLDENVSNKPGRYIIVNNDDDDGDGILDYFDGFNIDGDPGTIDDNVCNNEDDFYLMTFDINDIPGLPIELSVSYSDSDPSYATFTPPDQYQLPFTEGIRIWKDNGSLESRDKSAVSLCGDFLAPVTNPLPDQTITNYYIEGITPGVYEIEFSIKYKTESGSFGYCTDTVKVTVIGVDLLVNDTSRETDDYVVKEKPASGVRATTSARTPAGAADNHIPLKVRLLGPAGFSCNVPLSDTGGGDIEIKKTDGTLYPANGETVTVGTDLDLKIYGISASGALDDVMITAKTDKTCDIICGQEDLTVMWIYENDIFFRGDGYEDDDANFTSGSTAVYDLNIEPWRDNKVGQFIYHKPVGEWDIVRNQMEIKYKITPYVVIPDVEWDIRREVASVLWYGTGNVIPAYHPDDGSDWTNDDNINTDEDLIQDSTLKEIFEIDSPGYGHSLGGLLYQNGRFSYKAKFQDWVEVKIGSKWYICSKYKNWRSIIHVKFQDQEAGWVRDNEKDNEIVEGTIDNWPNWTE